LNDLTKNILLWVVIVLVLLAVFSRYMPTVGQTEEVRYSTFLDDVKSNRVDSVVVQGEMIYGVRKDKTQFKTFNPETDYGPDRLAAEIECGHRGAAAEAAQFPGATALAARAGTPVDPGIRLHAAADAGSIGGPWGHVLRQEPCAPVG